MLKQATQIDINLNFAETLQNQTRKFCALPFTCVIMWHIPVIYLLSLCEGKISRQINELKPS